MGFFSKLKNGLKKTKDALISKLNAVFRGGDIDNDFYEELEYVLISSDMGVETSQEIIASLKEKIIEKHFYKQEQARGLLKEIMISVLTETPKQEFSYPLIITIVGVNGVGKTTTIGKLANYFKSKHKSVSLVAGDTFRAAASEQLNEWAKRANVKIIKHQEGADPSAVVFDGISSAKAKNTDVLIVDTAGRLHTKINLMEELKKIYKILDRELPLSGKEVLLVLDATTGQNAVQQAKEFKEVADITGIILTKLDGTAKGGITFAIKNEYDIPVKLVGVGEGVDDIEVFDAKEFVSGIIDTEDLEE